MTSAPGQAQGAPPAAPQANAIGRMTGLTLFTPVRRRWRTFLRVGFFVSRHVRLFDRHVLQFQFIHFVRWSLVDGLPDGSGRRRGLRRTHMLFESNFDGPWEDYIDAFAYVIPHDIRLVWGRGPAFPAPPPAEPLKAWIARNSMGGGTYYCAYPEASTRVITGALELAPAFEELVASSARLGPDEFRAAYERFLAEHQARL